MSCNRIKPLWSIKFKVHKKQWERGVTDKKQERDDIWNYLIHETYICKLNGH